MKSFSTQRKGFTLIELLIVIAVIAILAAIAIPNLLASRKSANEASAIGSMRTINSAEATYRSRNGTYGTMAQIQSLLDYSLGNATSSSSLKSGYYFNIAGPTSGTAPTATQYLVTGSPGTASSGDRVFYTDESGTLFGAPSSTALPTTDASGNGTTLAPLGWSQIGQ